MAASCGVTCCASTRRACRSTRSSAAMMPSPRCRCLNATRTIGRGRASAVTCDRGVQQATQHPTSHPIPRCTWHELTDHPCGMQLSSATWNMQPQTAGLAPLNMPLAARNAQRACTIPAPHTAPSIRHLRTAHFLGSCRVRSKCSATHTHTSRPSGRSALRRAALAFARVRSDARHGAAYCTVHHGRVRARG